MSNVLLRTGLSLSCLGVLSVTLICGCTARMDSDSDVVRQITSVSAPHPDGIFRVPLMTNPPDLDPILVSDTTSDGVASKIFNTLLDYDPQLQLEPCLATAMPEISADGTQYNFTIREGVRFSNGREITATDFKYSLQRLASVRSKRSNLIEPIRGASEAIESARSSSVDAPEISGIEVLGERQLQITLEKPHAPFIYHLAMVNTAVVPRELVEEHGHSFSRNPTGTGPFILEEWREGTSLSLRANPDYFEGSPKLAAIHYRVIPEPLAQLEEYKAGNFEVLAVTQGVYPKWSNSNRANEVLSWPSLVVQYYGFNLEKEGSPYAGDSASARKLREAVNLSVDRKFLGEVLLEGRFFPANGILPPGILGHNSERPAFTLDRERAGQLLAEAGYPNGEGLPSVDLWFNTQGDNAKIAQAVQEDLKKVGIPIGLKMLDWGAFIEATDSGEPPFFRLGWVADYPDPENFLAFLFHSKNKGPNGNVSFYGHPQVDSLIDQSYAVTDMDERIRLLRQAESKIVADSPWLFLLFGRETILKKPYVKNFNPTGMCDDVQGNHVRWHLVELGKPGAQ
ncbi:MAG: ABC transporter substrate-binding protein [Planctomycetota bacterium]|nr:ABC transporter substrate-binding protein [Planctomycetota bacterium]